MFWREWSIARRLFAANLLFVVLLTAGLATVLVSDAGSRTYEQTRQRVLAVATAMANSPGVVAAASGNDPSATLQPYAESVMADANVDFITMMSPEGVRWTHPNPAEIGAHYVGSISQAQAGSTYFETTAGTLGPSVRVIVPIKDAAGTVRGMVAAGVTVSNVQVLVASRLAGVLAVSAMLLVGGTLASWMLGRYLRRVTFGWGPADLGQLFAYYESVLHSVREGIVLVDVTGSMVLYNDHAALLLGIQPSGSQTPSGAGSAKQGKGKPRKGKPGKGKQGKGKPRLASLGLPDSLRDLLESGRSTTDEVYLAGDRLLVVSQRPAQAPGSPTPAGTVATLRDHTELTALAGNLSSTQTLVEALRSQTHEHANRLHAIISLIEMGRIEEAVDFATAEHGNSVRLSGEFIEVLDEPFLGALLLGKRAQADERGVSLELSASGTLPHNRVDPRELVTLLGNLVDNAIDACAASAEHPTVWVDLLVADGEFTITVADNGPGLPSTGLEVLGRIGTTGKTSADLGGRGYGMALIRRATATLGGTITGENDGGAVMTVVMPLDPPPPTQPSPRQGHP